MIWVLFGVVWFLGTALTLRLSTLMMKERYQQRRAGNRYPYPDWADYVLGIVWMTILWPGSLAVLLAWKLAFPRGVKTQFDREQELKDALRKAKEEADASDRRIAELEKQVLAWVPREYDRSGGEAA